MKCRTCNGYPYEQAGHFDEVCDCIPCSVCDVPVTPTYQTWWAEHDGDVTVCLCPICNLDKATPLCDAYVGS